MGLFRWDKKVDWLDRFHLSEDFRGIARSEAQYPVAMEGLEITGDNLRILLEEFSQSERPLLHLYVPKEDREEARDFLLQRLGRNSLTILDCSVDQVSIEFLRAHSSVRFGFEHRNYTYVFQTEVLGRIQGEDPLFLTPRPETIFQERRSHQRYTLWPDHKVYLNGMSLLDISQRGVKLFTSEVLNSSEALENAVLHQPPIYDAETDDCYYEGGDVLVPRAVVTYELKQGKWHYYGLHFDQKWSDEQTKKLNDFLLGLRKRIFYSGEE